MVLAVFPIAQIIVHMKYSSQNDGPVNNRHTTEISGPSMSLHNNRSMEVAILSVL